MQRLLCLLLLGCALAAAGATPWHHASSPYRGEFELTEPPALPEAGVALDVPVCGLAFADGSDVRAFDDAGQPLPALAIGEGIGNSALVLVQPGAGTKRVYAYFGSRAKAASNRAAFLPSLLLDVRTFPGGPIGSWKEVERLVAASERIACLPVRQINQSYNPADSRDEFIMVFDGYLRVAQAGPQTFMLVSDDAGYLFVDDRLLISRDGERGVQDAVRGEFRGTIELGAGVHPIRCVVVDKGRDQMAVVGRFAGARDKNVLPPDAFVQGGRAKLSGVAARDAGMPCPAFRCTQLSYMGYQGIQYTEVELATLNGAAADWSFGDGSRQAGPTVRRLVVGLGSLPVRVRQGKSEATGLVQLPENPPPVRDIGNGDHFNQYAALIRQESPEKLSLPTLKAYRALLGYREANPDLFPVCNAILNSKDVDAALRHEVLLDMARATVATKPEAALWAYGQLLAADPPPPRRRQTAREFFEYALLCRRDARLAEKVARDFQRGEHEGWAGEPDTLRLLLALQAGQADPARALLQKLIDASRIRSTRAAAAIKRNAIEERFNDLLGGGFVADARRQLWLWEDLTPEDWGNGRLALARARFWRAAGLPQAGLAELDFALALTPLLPNLPEVEFLQAELQADQGQRDRARTLYQHVADKYPNHPVAARARTRLQRP